MSFNALVVDKDEAGAVSAKVEAITEDRLPEGDVTVAVEYSTLNYKDGLCLGSGGGLVRAWPHVPGIDFAGTVETSSDPRYAPGDKVVLTGWRVGEAHWGGYAQKARVKADWLVPLASSGFRGVFIQTSQPYSELQKMVDTLLERIQDYPGLVDIESDLKLMTPGYPVAVTGTAADIAGLPNNTQAAGGLLATATGGAVLIEEITLAKDATSLTGPTNVEISSNNAYGLTGVGAPHALKAITLLQNNENIACTGSDGTPLVPFVLESGKALYIHGSDSAGTSAGNYQFAVKGKALTDGATLV